MSITFLKEVSGRGGTIGEESELKYIFQSDSVTDSEYDVYRHTKCPKIGGRHPNSRFGLFYLKRGELEIEQSTSNWARWDVTANYTQLEPGEAPPQEQQDFTQDVDEAELPDFEPKISLEFEEFSKPLEFAINPATDEPAYPVVNSALEKYSPLPEVFRMNTTIRVFRNVDSNSNLLSDALELNGTINTDEFTFRRGRARIEVTAEQCRIKARLGEEQKYRTRTGRESYYTGLEVQFNIKPDTWKLKLLDAGTVFLSTGGKNIATRIADNDWGLAGGTTQKPFEDLNGNKIQGLLSGTGTKLGASQAAFFNQYDGYVTKKHKTFYEAITRK